MWSNRLMPNHLHLILTRNTPERIGRALGKAHLFPLRQRTQPRDRPSLYHLFKGALFLGRDGRGASHGCGALRGDEPGSGAARRGLAVVERAGASHRRDDGLVEVAPLISCCGGRFADLIAEEADAARVAALRAAETIGRPLGPPAFLDRLASLAGREPRPGSAARKPWLAEQAAS